ncbi:SurA N-terminal domain-containing protein [Acidimicrobiia bacterium EGI L10123]|uniref:SurA N-terminal domain-containing protein n=1 Tax=Salinilacustrithrix flava TaxID=2957203 RepID=UPI003D7C2292|nr:SurA N-terminal domain-containing protein [Acidimicrobiia bacterium EGI L10123]
MRPRTIALALLAAVTFLAGCGDDTDSEERADQEPTDTTADAADDNDGASGEAGSLGDDVAAVVDGEEIAAASIESHVEDFAANPQLAEQFQGEEGDAARAQLGAQILSSAIQSSILVSGAEDLDAPVTEEDVDAARAQVEEQAGGPEGLAAAMEQQGLSEDLLQLELRGVAAVENITDALDEAAGDDGSADDTPSEGEEGTELTPSEQRVQEHLMELATAADIRVHPDFGRWDAQTGQVLPPGV